MRAIKAALLWTLSVAAVLLTPLAAAPAPAAAATFAHRTSVSSAKISLVGQHSTRHGPASSPRSGVPDSQPALTTAKLVVSGGPSSSSPNGDAPTHAAGEPTALRSGQASTLAAGPHAGVDPGVRLGRSPPATHRA